MPPNALIGIALSYGDDSPVLAAFYKIAAQIFGQTLQWGSADLALHPSKALAREISDDPAAAIEYLFPIFQKPGPDEGRNTALLSSEARVLSADRRHVVSLLEAPEGVRMPRQMFFITFISVDGDAGEKSGQVCL